MAFEQSLADPAGRDATRRVDHRERSLAVIPLGDRLDLVLVGVRDHRASDAGLGQRPAECARLGVEGQPVVRVDDRRDRQDADVVA